ncbi:MAG: HEAT repeat domain-containing protein [Candidatus Omnitrophota bacterium]
MKYPVRPLVCHPFYKRGIEYLATILLFTFFYLLPVLPVSGQESTESTQTPTPVVQADPEEYLNKGVGFLEAKNYKEAIASFEKALEIKPDYAESYYNLAITYWEQKQYQKTITNLQKVLELEPESNLGKRAEKDLSRLKSAGIGIMTVTPKPEEVPKVKPKATLEELTADLEFGSTSKRREAAWNLRLFSEPDAVETLCKSARKTEEEPQVRVTAVESLSELADPLSIPTLKFLLGENFPAEGKFAAVIGLSKMETPESLAVILSVWAGSWPGGLTDKEVVGLVRKLGKEEFAEIVRPAYLQASGEKKIYTALALGLMKDATGVPALVTKLKEDYPAEIMQTPAQLTSFTAPKQPTGAIPGFPGASLLPSGAPPGMPGGPPGAPGMIPQIPAGPPQPTQLIIKEMPESVSARKNEAALRAEIVEILGICAGEKQTQFLVYLSKNDPEKEVRESAGKAALVLSARITKSKESYQKALTLVKENKIEEAFPFIQAALKENPDAAYAEEIKKLQAKLNYQKACSLLEGKKTEDMEDKEKEKAISLLQSALNLDPEASFRKDAEEKLSKLQERPAAPAGPGMPPGMPGGALPPGRPTPPKRGHDTIVSS